MVGTFWLKRRIMIIIPFQWDCMRVWQFSTGSIHGLTAVNVLDNNLDINTGKNHDCPSVAGCLIDRNALFRFYQRDGNISSLSGRVWIIVN